MVNTFYSKIYNILIESGFVIAKRNDVWLLLDNENEESSNVMLSSRRLGDLLHTAEKEIGL
ncbi:MAG: hypothetical protein Tp178MES00d2C33159851_53 [Prokaryotic dsDNA virus sp.]|nr:MAG: hypothetical protein Tp178MES00d2C33159851_53 [Prokaryotic dsDNA virus sp.]